MRDPKEILRAAANRWYKAKMGRMDNISNADEFIREKVAFAAEFARDYKHGRGGQFADLLTQVLVHADGMTVEEQEAVEKFVCDEPNRVCLVMQLALG